jgi:polyketide cyclase/dehydrase/lipid transport protein
VIEVVRRVRTTCPLDAVADYLSDFTATAEWDPHTLACRRIGEGVGIRPGVAYDNTQRIGPFRTTMRYTVSDFFPGDSIALRSRSRLLDAEDAMSFDGDESGATVTYTARFQLKGLAAAAAPLLRMMLNRVADDGADGMRRALDGVEARVRKNRPARRA